MKLDVMGNCLASAEDSTPGGLASYKAVWSVSLTSWWAESKIRVKAGGIKSFDRVMVSKWTGRPKGPCKSVTCTM